MSWNEIPRLWTDDNIVRREMDRTYGASGDGSDQPYVYNEVGSVVGRCVGHKKGDHHPYCADASPRLWQIVDRDTRAPIIGGLSRSDATYRAIEMRREAWRTGTFLSVEVVPEQALDLIQSETVSASEDMKLKRVAYVLGMALLQSSLPLDSETIAARDYAVSLGKDRRVMFPIR